MSKPRFFSGARGDQQQRIAEMNYGLTGSPIGTGVGGNNKKLFSERPNTQVNNKLTQNLTGKRKRELPTGVANPFQAKVDEARKIYDEEHPEITGEEKPNRPWIVKVLGDLPGKDLPLAAGVGPLASGTILIVGNHMLMLDSVWLDRIGLMMAVPGGYVLVAKGAALLAQLYGKSSTEIAQILGDKLQDGFDEGLGFLGADIKPKEPGKCPPAVRGWLGPIPVFGAWNLFWWGRCKITGKGKVPDSKSKNK